MLEDYESFAPRHSKACDAACDSVRAAERALQKTLSEEYPRGRAVRVIHSRGEFSGKVIGWDSYGCRVEVENTTSGKSKYWWSRHVELI